MLPLRNVAYLDDFAYIKNVEEFIETGNLRITDWASTSLVFPILWGALFAKLFGFSIKILHVSNLVLFYFGLMAFYGILRQFNLDKFKSVVFTLFLLSYPWVFQYLFSFNSDTFYVSLINFTIYFYLKGLSTNKLFYYFLGSLFAGFSFLTRQLAITFPIAIGITLFLKFKIDKKVDWSALAVSLLPIVLIIIGYYKWISIAGASAAGYIFFNEYTKRAIIDRLIPPNLQRFGDTSRLYWDLFLQRPSIYFVSINNHILPFFLLFALQITKFRKFIVSNFKSLATTSLIFSFYVFLVWTVWQDKILYRIPQTIFSMDKMIDNWQFIWPRLFFLGIPFWIGIFLLTFNKIRKLFFILKRPLISGRVFFSIFALFSFFLFYKAFEDIFSTNLRPQLYTDSLLRSSAFLRTIYVLLNPTIIIETFKEIWIILLILFLIFIFFYVTIIKNKLRIKNLNLPILLITLLFLGHFSITNFLAHSHWEEYTIAFVPFIILILALILKNIPLSKIRAVILIFLLLFFSLQITRNRYQENGATWELGTQMVRSGIDPKRVVVFNMSWRRYWLWQDAFNKMVNQKYSGDKYKVRPAEFNPVDEKLLEGVFYQTRTINTSEDISRGYDDKSVILQSEPTWLFAGKSFIVWKKFIVTKEFHKAGT